MEHFAVIEAADPFCVECLLGAKSERVEIKSASQAVLSGQRMTLEHLEIGVDDVAEVRMDVCMLVATPVRSTCINGSSRECIETVLIAYPM